SAGERGRGAPSAQPTGAKRSPKARDGEAGTPAACRMRFKRPGVPMEATMAVRQGKGGQKLPALQRPFVGQGREIRRQAWPSGFSGFFGYIHRAGLADPYA